MARQGFRPRSRTKDGYRSGLESRVAKDLNMRGASFEYEPHAIQFEVPARTARYTPDFVLSNGILIEAKGQFTSKDRVKHLNIKESRPELDIRFVFQRPHAKLYKGSKSSYADWCVKHGFLWADRTVPEEWLNE